MNKALLITLIVIGLFVLAGLGILYTGKLTKAPQVGTSAVTGNPQALPSATPSPMPEENVSAVGERSFDLQVTSPANNSTSSSPNVTIKGKTMPGAEVFVNDAKAVADKSGNFSVAITLEEGQNPILIVANDAGGNAAEMEMTLTYEPQ